MCVSVCGWYINKSGRVFKQARTTQKKTDKNESTAGADASVKLYHMLSLLALLAHIVQKLGNDQP